MPRTLVPLLAALALLAPFAALAADAPAVPEPAIRTLAGSGQYGTADGPVATASFMQPTGVAASRAGVYVTDGAANNVRLIAGGTVRLVAGSRTGAAGFADGPVATALFNRPFGVVVGSDGTVFVVDSVNIRIRAIRNGVVSTVAGNGSYGGSDGIAKYASFKVPKGIAIDDDGNLYVADFGAGVRKISPAGDVTTVKQDATVYGVAVRGGGASLIVAFTDAQGIHVIGHGAQRDLASTADRQPSNENNRIGAAFGIAIVDANTFVVTDVWTNAVRYVNFPDLPFRPLPLARTLVGGAREAASSTGGFRDGDAATALVRAPYGIARLPDGRVIIADGGNRRVRALDGLDVRQPIFSDLSNLDFPARAYRVAIIGDSFTWSNVLWPESISGVLEAGLLERQQTLGLSSKPSVKILSASGGSLKSAIDFIDTNFGDGQADLVILAYDKLAMYHDFEAEPALRESAWKTALPERAAALASRLKKNGTAFAMLTVPLAFDVAPYEQAASLEDSPYQGSYNYAEQFRTGLEFEDAFVAKNFHVIRELRAFAAADRQPNAVPLFNARDNHLTIQGCIAIGRNVLADVEAWRPWAGAKPAGR